jgi:flagellar biogenesis protein FliO
LVYRIILFFAIILLFSGNNTLASAENISITDFTMHKVVPVQDMAAPPPKHKSVVKIAEPAKQPKRAQPRPKFQKTAHLHKKHFQKIVVIPETKPEQKVQEVAKTEPAPSAKSQEFNKQNYIETLNQSLNKTQVPKPLNNAHPDYVVRPMLSLMIVIVLIFLCAVVYNKLRGINPNALLSGKLQGMDINKFKVLASSSLGQGKLIHLVEINGKQLVVGSTNNSINLLTEINPEDMAKLKAKAAAKEKDEDFDEMEYTEPDSYSAKYPRVYKDYLE